MDVNTITDDIIRKAAAGDRVAFEEIYKAYGSLVYNVSFRVLNNQEDAQEVTQDVFVKIFHKLKNFRFDSSLKTWIYRITVNTALNYRKKRARHENQIAMNESTIDYLVEHNDTSELLEKESREKQIEKLLSYLNPDQKTCIILRNIEGLSYEEIAHTLKININTVRTRLKRAREKLLEVKEEVMSHEME